MPQRFRARLADAAVAVLFHGDAVFALGFDPGELQFLPEDLREFVEADLDLENMLALLLPARSDAAFTVDRVPGFTLPLPHASIVVVPVAKVGNVDAANGNADVLLTLAPEQFAARQKLPQVLANPALDDFPKPLMKPTRS